MNHHHETQTDWGKLPHVVDMPKTAKENTAFRIANWTGDNLQLTFMSIPPCGEIGLESHACIEQMIRVEAGCAIVRMGVCKDNLNLCWHLNAGDAVFIPKKYWHNVLNASAHMPLKLSSVYAPPAHPKGTIHLTKDDDPHSHGCPDCRK